MTDFINAVLMSDKPVVRAQGGQTPTEQAALAGVQPSCGMRYAGGGMGVECAACRGRGDGGSSQRRWQCGSGHCHGSL